MGDVNALVEDAFMQPVELMPAATEAPTPSVVAAPPEAAVATAKTPTAETFDAGFRLPEAIELVATVVAVTGAEDVCCVLAHVLGMAFELNDNVEDATGFDCSLDGEGGGPGAFGGPGPFVCIGYITLGTGVLTIPFRSAPAIALLLPPDTTAP